MKYIVRDQEADTAAPLGGKARALAELRDADLPIPAWFVVCPQAFHDSLTGEPARPGGRGAGVGRRGGGGWRRRGRARRRRARGGGARCCPRLGVRSCFRGRGGERVT